MVACDLLRWCGLVKWPEPLYGDAVCGSAWFIQHDLEFGHLGVVLGE